MFDCVTYNRTDITLRNARPHMNRDRAAAMSPTGERRAPGRSPLRMRVIIAALAAAGIAVLVVAALASSRDNDASLATNSLETLEATSIIQDDQILDSEILVEEVEVALRLLKLGRSKGADGLSAEHLIYGGTAIVLWLKKIFNRIISLEEVPSCLKEGVIIPVYKGKGKDPMVTHSYRGITLSSVIAKTFEIVILNRMSPVLDRLGFPDINQTAFQKGISCADAIFSTQEVLLHYIRQGESPFLCFHDIEKAFDSIEFPSLAVNWYKWEILAANKILV